jgi:hypothetical protein
LGCCGSSLIDMNPNLPGANDRAEVQAAWIRIRPTECLANLLPLNCSRRESCAVRSTKHPYRSGGSDRCRTGDIAIPPTIPPAADTWDT